jgi:putative CRISPR-associated protein (TIGR02619 family)
LADNDEAWAPKLADAVFREELTAFVAEKPRERSAEVNSLTDFMEHPEFKVEGVYLVSTRTRTGELCARAIKDYLEKQKGVRCEQKEIQGYLDKGQSDPERAEEEFIKDLGELRDAVVRFTQNKAREGKQVLVNATGGFKGETATLAALGHLLGCRVYYQHEAFRRPVFLPPVGMVPDGRARDAVRCILDMRPSPPHRLIGDETKALVDGHAAGLKLALEQGLITRRERERGREEFQISLFGKFLVDTLAVVAQAK